MAMQMVDDAMSKDERVKRLLVMKSRDERINQLYEWVKDGTLDLKDFSDLFKIVAREAEMTEIHEQLKKLKPHLKQTPDQNAELAALKALRGAVGVLITKAGVSAGQIETK